MRAGGDPNVVNEGDLCPECKTGQMHYRGSRVYEGHNESRYQGIGEETGFQCDHCGAKWNSISRTFTHRYSIKTNKKSTKPKADTKGAMKKMKDTAKPRRQSPR
ncbi:MAG TPA: hypothetical protein VGQ13_07990 [Nitrososphaera sp.]|nr:hypothetical protein [Nitrososphaera sp.]